MEQRCKKKQRYLSKYIIITKACRYILCHLIVHEIGCKGNLYKEAME
jgi:hypothetical protein